VKIARIDRIALDDVGGNPRKIAEAIHLQLGDLSGPIPVYEIARALDIDEIRESPLSNLEGALITTPEKSYGAILVNLRSSPQRRRFTAGHELGHFLNPWHMPPLKTGFACTQVDMIISFPQDRYYRQEAEANAFSIELLTPRNQLARYLRESANLEHALEIASAFDISKESAARRYIGLHHDCLALVVSHDEKVRYFERNGTFPRLCLGKGDSMPALPPPKGGQSLSAIEETHPSSWLTKADGIGMFIQSLHQQNGFAISLLSVETPENESDELEDSFERLSKFGSQQEV
jgi:hypothetical protein